MARPAARQTASIQPEPPKPSVVPPAEPAAPASPPKAAGLTVGWRVALFIWVTAFIGLLAYELLTTLVRSLSRLF